MGIKGCTYVINGSSYDEANQMAIFYATITGTHVGDGGPVPPTNKQTVTDYVYALTMNDEGKVMERLGFTYTDTITAYGGTSVLYTLSRGSWV